MYLHQHLGIDGFHYPASSSVPEIRTLKSDEFSTGLLPDSHHRISHIFSNYLLRASLKRVFNSEAIILKLKIRKYRQTAIVFIERYRYGGFVLPKVEQRVREVTMIVDML